MMFRAIRDLFRKIRDAFARSLDRLAEVDTALLEAGCPTLGCDACEMAWI